MAARGYTGVLPADMVDEYLTFDQGSLLKLEKKMNAASADGYKLIGKVRSYIRQETGTHYAETRFWAVMTKRVDPALLAGAVESDKVTVDDDVVVGPNGEVGMSDAEEFQARMRQ